MLSGHGYIQDWYNIKLGDINYYVTQMLTWLLSKVSTQILCNELVVDVENTSFLWKIEASRNGNRTGFNKKHNKKRNIKCCQDEASKYAKAVLKWGGR